jgi:hypothetical protein
MFKLLKNNNGDWVIKYRENGKVVFITAEDLNSTSWELYYNWFNNRQQIINLAYEFLIMNDKLEK